MRFVPLDAELVGLPATAADPSGFISADRILHYHVKDPAQALDPMLNGYGFATEKDCLRLFVISWCLPPFISVCSSLNGRPQATRRALVVAPILLNNSIMARLNAGISSGLRAETKLPSVTAS